MKDYLVVFTLILFILSIPACIFLGRYLDIDILALHRFDQLNRVMEAMKAKESCDRFTHIHTGQWESIEKLLPWQFRLRLSRHRGKERALKWRIKLFSLFHGIGPKMAQWILEEYMITTKVEDLPPPPNTWVCPHCGTANVDTALFCKDCGEYK